MKRRYALLALVMMLFYSGSALAIDTAEIKLNSSQQKLIAKAASAGKKKVNLKLTVKQTKILNKLTKCLKTSSGTTLTLALPDGKLKGKVQALALVTSSSSYGSSRDKKTLEAKSWDVDQKALDASVQNAEAKLRDSRNTLRLLLAVVDEAADSEKQGVKSVN